MTCLECACPLVPQRTWGKLNPVQRADNLKAGVRKVQGRGLCANCYMRHHSRGEFPKRTTTTASSHPCSRCGIQTTEDMCADCAEVVAA